METAGTVLVKLALATEAGGMRDAINLMALGPTKGELGARV